MRRVTRSSLCLLGLLIGRLCFAQAGSWKHIGPWSADVRTLVFDRAAVPALYAGTVFQGVFRTTDRAKAWTRVSPGYGDCTSRAATFEGLAADAQSPGTLYAANYDNGNPTDYGYGVCKSADGGATWTVVGPAGVRVTMVTTSPVVPGAVYIGAVNSDPFNHGATLFRSLDGGASWVPILAGLGRGSGVRKAVESPRTPAIIYVAAYDSYVSLESQVFKTADGGTRGLPSRPACLPRITPSLTSSLIREMMRRSSSSSKS